MPNPKRDTGDHGEQLALEYLEQKGYTILARNWTSRKLEIDLVARLGNQLVIVEVKTRSGNDYGEPETFVDRKKQRHLIRAANAFIVQNDLDLDTRFDIISVLKSGEIGEITHLEDAFYPVLR